MKKSNCKHCGKEFSNSELSDEGLCRRCNIKAMDKRNKEKKNLLSF